ETDRAHHEVEPGIPAELPSPLDELVEVESCDLDGLQPPYVEGSLLGFVVGGVVEQVELAPGAALQEPVVLVDEVLRDVDVLVVEVLQVRPELVLAGDESHIDLVDEPVLAPLLDP